MYYKFNSESPNIKLTNATAEYLSYTGSEDIKSLEHQDPAAVDESIFANNQAKEHVEHLIFFRN